MRKADCLILLMILVSAIRAPARAADWKPGVVTVYHQRFEGRRTASGERFSHKGMTVACKSMPFGTRLELRYGRNGRAIARVTDRGALPLHRRGIPQFDTTTAVARKLGLYNRQCGRRVRWRIKTRRVKDDHKGMRTLSDAGSPRRLHDLSPDPDSMGNARRLCRYPHKPRADQTRRIPTDAALAIRRRSR
jgi:hypothetical protein